MLVDLLSHVCVSSVAVIVRVLALLHLADKGAFSFFFCTEIQPGSPSLGEFVELQVGMN